MSFPSRDQYHCETCWHAAKHAPPVPMLLAKDWDRRDKWRREAGTAEARVWVTTK